jgi:uncharacterized membrane protein YGL010W
MKKIDQLLAEYGESHQNETNEIIHWICVPLIFFSVIGMLWSIPHAYFGDSIWLNWGVFGLLFALQYYIRLSFGLFIGMIAVSIAIIVAIFQIEKYTAECLGQICIIIFVLAWIGQFYGHKIEGKKPSFLKDLQFLLIGPAWLMSFVYKKLGLPY